MANSIQSTSMHLHKALGLVQTLIVSHRYEIPIPERLLKTLFWGSPSHNNMEICHESEDKLLHSQWLTFAEIYDVVLLNRNDPLFQSEFFKILEAAIGITKQPKEQMNIHLISQQLLRSFSVAAEKPIRLRPELQKWVDQEAFTYNQALELHKIFDSMDPLDAISYINSGYNVLRKLLN